MSNINNKILNYFVSIISLDELFEFICDGLYGGIHHYKIEPNNGIFNSDFLTKVILIQQGDNDFDYAIGVMGYEFLTSKEGLKKLSKKYLNKLKTYENEYISSGIIENCKNSLLNIIEEK